MSDEQTPSPGPWNYDRVPPHERAELGIPEDVGEVFIIGQDLDVHHAGDALAMVLGPCRTGSTEANARVMAAGWSTLAALKAIEWSGTAVNTFKEARCCPYCGSFAPDTFFEDEQERAAANPGVHDEQCIVAAAIAKAEKAGPRT